MSLQTSDLKVYRAAVNNDTVSNGGAMSTTESVSGVTGNLFPRVSLSERTAGINRYRKAFHRVMSQGNYPLYDGYLLMFKETPAADAVTFFSTGFPQTQGDVAPDVATFDHYGAAALVNAVSAGATVVRVQPEQTVYTIFRVGERVYITNKATYDAVVGDEEYATIASIDPGPGSSLDLTLTGALVSGYLAEDTRVCSVMDFGDIQSLAAVTASSVAGSGLLDPAAVTVSQRGGVYQSVTLTFTSATNFTASSDVVGSLGTGTTGTTFAPVNPSFSAPYLSIPSTAWSGVFASGDSVTLRTTPSAKPIMYLQQVPAASPAFSGNSFIMVFAGETE